MSPGWSKEKLLTYCHFFLLKCDFGKVAVNPYLCVEVIFISKQLRHESGCRHSAKTEQHGNCYHRAMTPKMGRTAHMASNCTT